MHVSNLEDIDEDVIIETTHDVNELMKHSITNTAFKECSAKDACNGIPSLDTPSHKNNVMFYLSLCMINDDSFICHKFKMLLNKIKYDPLLYRKGIIYTVCDTVTDSLYDNSNECLVTKTVMGDIADLFNKYCDQMDSEMGDNMLVEKNFTVINIMFLITHNFEFNENIYACEEVLKLKVPKKRGEFLNN